MCCNQHKCNPNMQALSMQVHSSVYLSISAILKKNYFHTALIALCLKTFSKSIKTSACSYQQTNTTSIALLPSFLPSFPLWAFSLFNILLVYIRRIPESLSNQDFLFSQTGSLYSLLYNKIQFLRKSSLQHNSIPYCVCSCT